MMGNSAKKAKERLKADIGFPEEQENGIELDKMPVGQSHSGRGVNKLLAVIKELKHELAAKEAAVTVLMADHKDIMIRNIQHETEIDRLKAKLEKAEKKNQRLTEEVLELEATIDQERC